MTYTLKFAPWTARLRAPFFAALFLLLASCNGTDAFTPGDNADPETDGLGSEPETILDEPSFTTSFAGGIPMGLFALPTTLIGSRYNGALRNIYPRYLVSELRAIRDRGGKVIINLAGAPSRYKDRYGRFSLSMWKTSVDRFKGIDLSSFIRDGTIIAHFLLDEPYSAKRWGYEIPYSTLEAMAKYSKARYPTLATTVRSRPDQLGKHYYLDAAWSQYHSRFGDPYKYIAHDVAVAKNKGMALIVGMNVINGNGGRNMTASQLKSIGGALLSSSYTCAFVSWKYDSYYLSKSGIKEAMSYLRNKAQSRSSKSCRS